MKRIYHFYLTCMTLTLTMPMMIVSAFAVDDMWTVANNQTRKSNNSPARQEARPIGIRNEPSAKGMFSAQRPDLAGNRADVSQGTLTRPTTGNRAVASKNVLMPSTLIKGSVKNSKEISSSRKQRREKHERK